MQKDLYTHKISQWSVVSISASLCLLRLILRSRCSSYSLSSAGGASSGSAGSSPAGTSSVICCRVLAKRSLECISQKHSSRPSATRKIPALPCCRAHKMWNGRVHLPKQHCTTLPPPCVGTHYHHQDRDKDGNQHAAVGGLYGVRP